MRLSARAVFSFSGLHQTADRSPLHYAISSHSNAPYSMSVAPIVGTFLFAASRSLRSAYRLLVQVTYREVYTQRHSLISL